MRTRTQQPAKLAKVERIMTAPGFSSSWRIDGDRPLPVAVLADAKQDTLHVTSPPRPARSRR